MLLGLDLGTTNVKALVVGRDGAIVTRGSQPISLRHTADGGIEQDIEEIWQAMLGAIRAAGREADLAAVDAIGVSSQGAAIQVRTPDGRCIGPVISWMDPRGRPFDEKFQQEVGAERLAQRLGHGVSAMAIGQVLRLRQIAPDLLAAPNVLGFVGDTIVQRLCGRAAHDCSSLSIASLYNPKLRQADPEVLGRLGLSLEQLPELLPARQPAGALNTQVAGQTHLPVGILVGPAIHDQYAAALGCGAIHMGDVMFGAGTAWVLLAVADHLVTPVVPSAWVCDHLVPQRWGQLLSLVVGGSAFKWALDMVDLADAAREEIDKLIESVPPGSDELRLLPFLDCVGGRNRPVGGRLSMLKLSHRRGHLLRATVEGLCFELTRQLGWLETSGCAVGKLIMCGGASGSRSTPRIVADVTGRPVICPLEKQISAFGAAVLAQAMLQNDMPLEQLYKSMAGRSSGIQPSETASAYADMTQDYIEAVDRAIRMQLCKIPRGDLECLTKRPRIIPPW